MTNNQLSRQVLAFVAGQEKPAKFHELAGALKLDERILFKNLFYLEEHGFVLLATSIPSDAVYPQIHLIRLTDQGRAVLQDPGRLDRAFPLDVTPPPTTAPAPAAATPPRGAKPPRITYAKVLDRLAAEIKAQGKDTEARKKTLRKIADLKKLGAAKKYVSF